MTDDHARMWRSWIPETLADRYEIERELGAGAAAVTVAAQDTRLGRQVAIKILKPEADVDQEFSRRFTREARAAAAINHPNVVSVFDVGHEGGLLYLVMQFVDGTDLKHLIQREGALPWPRAIEIARDVLAGLAPIHAAGIVHRDIKPQNVLIGRNGEVKVTDFGVAHVERDAALTTAGTTVGTASYMAPEQAQGRTPTPAADVYAVGVMLYELVSGRLPFNEPTSIATMLAHIQQNAPDPVAPAGLAAIPPGVVAVIRQAMAKDPASRFRTAAAMRAALEHIGEGTGTATAQLATAGQTEVVPTLRQPREPARSRPAAQARPRATPAPTSRAHVRESGGFGARLAAILAGLAIVLAATAGALWLIEERPNLLDGVLGGGDGPTATMVAPTMSPTPEPEQPGVIEPIDADEPTPPPTEIVEPSPTPTPVPTSTPTSTPTPEPALPTPTPTVPVIVPGDESPVDDGDNQIIEPIEGSTIVVEPDG